LKITSYNKSGGSILFFWIALILIIGCKSKNDIQKNKDTTLNDSVVLLINKSKVKTGSIEERKHNLLSAYSLNESQENDSIKNRALLKISHLAYKLNDSVFFRHTNKEALNLSLKLQDTFRIAQTHWQKGIFYSKKEKIDSSYYHYFHASKYFNLIDDRYNEGMMLYNMAFAQGRIEDFIGAETNLFKAISIYKSLEENKKLYRSYGLLSAIYRDLEEYEKSLFYREKSFEYLNKFEDTNNYKSRYFNSLGLIYQSKKKYEKAITCFTKALSNDSLYYQNIRSYARLKDNFAYTRLLSGDTLNVKNELLASLKIRDSINNKSGVLIVNLHLGEYHLIHKDSSTAFSYAKEAYEIAKEATNHRDLLASLVLLSKTDVNNASAYLKEHIEESKKLEKHQRRLRNQFTRIRFETDEYIEETNRLSSQQTIILVGSFALLTILSLLYFMRLQRSKNRALQSEAEQQQANEEVYRLLLKQQAKLEEGRLNERHRISEELHDGVLGRIFGTRMGMGFLDLKGDDETKAKHQLYVDELQEIEKEIRVISHELKSELLSGKADYIQVVEHLVQEQSVITGFEYKITDDDTVHWSMINDAVKINCYRMVQEALQNINKYAQAKLVTIHFSVNNSALRLKIKDNGIGFDSTKKSQGIGLKNITARTKKINGTFEISSTIGEGTLLNITIPLAESIA